MNLDELQALLGDSPEAIELLKVDSHVPVKLVPRPTQSEIAENLPPTTLQEKLQEIEMAQKFGYLLCKCSWPPQIMVLTGADHIYRCRRCSRVREM
ncbi:MAG: hypothetical protein Q8L60_08415 [Gammaproteobacteria bacterium]|nr:hypothetical protein [Gammaproteobacteria bacterium]MDP2139194.1 hypothetical protein [Gammaproteobacteria bacterium]MDP2349037.1 hypothetical protein [Gammaproteobacteria bacterium]